MNIKFSYLYRDGGNYKNFNEIIFYNPNDRTLVEVECIIKEKLIDGTWFYCHDWGLPDMHFKNYQYDSEIDVDWHEFDSIEETEENATDAGCIEEFLLLVSMTKTPW